MQTLLTRLSLLVAFAAFAIAAHAQIQLPSVPVGGALEARVTLSQLGGPALAGVPLTLSVVGNCGTFQGAPTTNVVTDSSGEFLFTFTPNDVPGLCTIHGRSGNTLGSAHTNIYRPAELQIATFPDQGVVLPIIAGTGNRQMRFAVSANGSAVYGVQVGLDPPVALAGNGAPPALNPTISFTNASGQFVLAATFPGSAGIWDYTFRAASSQRTFRIQQQAAVTVLPLARSLEAVDELKAVHGRTVVTILEGPASCKLRDATRTQAAAPTGTTDFPQGVLTARIFDCPPRATVTLRVDYAAPLPTDGAVYASMFAPGSGQWALVPLAVVSGNTLTVPLEEGSNIDSGNGTELAVNSLGVARRGQPVDQAKPAVHDMWWAGTTENGWGLSMAQSTDGNVFAAIYAYDDAGKPTWWVIPSVTWDYARGGFEERLYSTLGTPWHAYDARYVIVSKAGSARFTLSGTGNATFDYGIDGVTGRKSLERQAFGPPDSRAVPNVNGMWWGGASQNGWGVSIVQHNATLFMVWFTYDETMKPTWFVLPGGQWTGANTYEGRIYRTRGSPWLGRAYDASRFVVTDVGPYRVTFNGTSATMAYTIEGRTGSLALERQAPF